MIKKLLSTISLLSLLLAASCASQPEKDTKNPFDPITLKENLIEGKTTQTDMIKTFGAPDMVTEGSSKEDVWTYNQTKHESTGTNLGGGILGWMPFEYSALVDVYGSVNKNESSSKSVTLIAFFDKKKVLKSYQLSKVKI